jgi:hypothetical protein
MSVSPISPSYNSSIQWSTLHIEPVYERPPLPQQFRPLPDPASPAGVSSETARMMETQMSSMPLTGVPVAAGNIFPAASSIKMGQSAIAIVPTLGFNSWGF